MAYCTECGKKLPDSAVFCPNCGHRCQPPRDTSQNEYYDADAQNEPENEPECSSEPSPKQEDESRFTSGIDSRIYKNGSDGQNKRDGKAAVIVICSVLFLLMVAAALFFTLRGSRPDYTGYWESTGVDVGNGQVYPDLYGQSINGFIAVQIEKDGTIKLVSRYGNGVINGSWREAADGIRAEINDDIIFFDYDDDEDTLTLEDSSGYGIIFDRADGSIGDDSVWDDRDKVSLGGEGSADTVAGSGNVGNESYYISVVGAEQFKDVDNKSAIRVYFDFTNNSDYTISAYNALNYYAKQDGKALTETYSWNDADVYGNISRAIRPGVTIRCCSEFTYKANGGSIDFILYDYDLGEDAGTVTATYVPGQFPGAPATFTAKTVENPKWTLSLPGEGTLDEHYYVTVTEAELLDDYYGEPAIRIYYEFTNNGEKAAALSDVLCANAYQDGISLDSDYPTVDLETDESFYREIKKGEKVTASYVFLLRNTSSPVEAEIGSYYTYDAVGQTFKIS